jgi:hypothetical protein
MPSRFHLVNGSTFVANSADWRWEDTEQEAIEATGHFAHEEGYPWNPPPKTIALFIPVRSVLWWQESDQFDAEPRYSADEVRERLEAEAEKLERPNKRGEDFTAATLRKVKAQGIRDALAAFPASTSEEGR